MNKIIAAFAAALIITTAAVSYSDSVQTDLQDNLIRLHIIADSDDEDDQNVKLKVRDAVLADVRSRLSNGANRTDIINELDNIEETALRTLSENGFEYGARAEYGKFEFPRKTYKSMTLPSGEYYGLRVVLGSGQGHNWWCVMYPPLCFSEGGEASLSHQSEDLLKESLGENTYDVITSSDETVVKLKIVELAQQLKNMTDKNF